MATRLMAAIVLVIVLAVPSTSFALNATLYAGQISAGTSPTTASLSTLATLPSAQQPVQTDANGNKAIFLACQGLAGPATFLLTSTTQSALVKCPPKSFSLANGTVTVTFEDLGTITCIANCGTAGQVFKMERARVLVNNSQPTVKKLSVSGVKATINFTSGTSASFRIDAQTGTGDLTALSCLSPTSCGGSIPFGVGTGAGTLFRRNFSAGQTRVSPSNNRFELTGFISGNLVNNSTDTQPTTADPSDSDGSSVEIQGASTSTASAGFSSLSSCTTFSTSCTASIGLSDTEGIGCGTATTACLPTLRKVVAATVNRTGDILEIPNVDPAYVAELMSEDAEQTLLQILGQANIFTFYPKGFGYTFEFQQPSPATQNVFQSGTVPFKAIIFQQLTGTFNLVFPLEPPFVFPTPLAAGDASFVSVTPAEKLGDGSFALVKFEKFTTGQASFFFDVGDPKFSSFRMQFFTPAHVIEACYGAKASAQNGCSQAAPNIGTDQNLFQSTDKIWRLDDGNWTGLDQVKKALRSLGADTSVTRARLILDAGVLAPEQTAGPQVVDLFTWTLEFTQSDGSTKKLSFSPPPASDPVQLAGNLPQVGLLITHLSSGQSLRVDWSLININQSQYVFNGITADALSEAFGPGRYQARWTVEEFGVEQHVDFCVQSCQ